MYQLRRFDVDTRKQWFEQVSKRRFADPAEAEGGQGDTQLTGREVGVELVVYGTQDMPAPAIFFRQGVNLGGAQFDDGELGGNEEAVEQHQKQSE